MTKAKKTKAPTQRTALDRITAQLRTVLRREATDIILIGNLLIEARKHMDHGEWQPWLAENFDMSYRTARRYESAAEYVERQKQNCHVSHFANLSASVLYRLAEGGYSEQEEAEILAQAKAGTRIDQARAWAICEALAPPDDDDTDDADDNQEDGGEDGAEEAPPDPEMEAILSAGADPAVPPPAPIPPPPDFALRDFDAAIDTLKRLMTKRAAQFAASIHSAHDLEAVESFLRAVTETKAAAANGRIKGACQRSAEP
jgi:hypothetical protein